MTQTMNITILVIIIVLVMIKTKRLLDAKLEQSMCIDIDTPEKRKIIYVKMRMYLKHNKADLRLGFCAALSSVSTNTLFLWNMPELYLYKPDNDPTYWFPINVEGRKKRIEILDSIISKL